MILELIETNQKKIISPIIKSRLIAEEASMLIEDLDHIIQLPNTFLYGMSLDGKINGFIIVSKVEDYDEETGTEFDIMLIEEIWVRSDVEDMTPFADEIVKDLLQVSSELKIKTVEVMVTKDNTWIEAGLDSHGFRIEEVHVKKVIPFSKSIEDLFELINESLPFPKVVQIVLAKEDEELVEFVDSLEEIMELLNEGWNPELFHIVYEPEPEDHQKILDKSSEIIKWDEIELVYRN